MKALAESYGKSSRFTTPFIVKLSLDPTLENERTKIERWFDSLPEAAKADMRARLRSVSTCQHFAAYYELITYHFLSSIGYSVILHPKLKEGEPDLLVKGKNLDKPMIVEVATVFDDPQWQEKERRFDQILDRIDRIEHYFLLDLTVESEDIPEVVNYDKIERFITEELDRLYSQSIENPAKMRYEENGLILEITAVPNTSKTSVVGSHGLPVRWIGTKQLENALMKKVNKYKSMKELEYYFVIAVNVTNMPAGERGLLDTLFGKISVTITRNKNGKPISTQAHRDYSGFFTPKPGLAGKARNTRVSAIINIESKWGEQETNNERTVRLHYFRFIHNHWARYPISYSIFDGFPQFHATSDNEKGISFGWFDQENMKPFDC